LVGHANGLAVDRGAAAGVEELALSKVESTTRRFL
jgi:hypothetical protein